MQTTENADVQTPSQGEIQTISEQREKCATAVVCTCISQGSPVLSTSVAAEDQLSLRFSAVLDESPGKLENPATVSGPETKKPLRTKSVAATRFIRIYYTPCKLLD